MVRNPLTILNPIFEFPIFEPVFIFEVSFLILVGGSGWSASATPIWAPKASSASATPIWGPKAAWQALFQYGRRRLLGEREGVQGDQYVDVTTLGLFCP